MTNQVFGTIYADPPWPYDSGGPVGNGGRGRKNIDKIVQVSSVAQYGSMSIRDICQLKPLAECNSHLYLWTTNTFMVEAHEVARAWGFAPKTIITWVKTRKADGQPSMKTGWYYRSATEHLLFAVRGSLRLAGPPAPTAILHARLPHSVKPDCVYDIIERQSPGPYLEMFARRTRPGWVSWGNQI